MHPLNGRSPFHQVLELVRKVHNDCCVDVDTNHYSVPWILIGSEVLVQIIGGTVRVHCAEKEVAHHPECCGRRQWIRQDAHFKGVVGGPDDDTVEISVVPEQEQSAEIVPELARPLSEYEEIVGGRW